MTANKNTETYQGDGGPPPPPPPPGQPEQPGSRNDNTVFKSGPLFISSKGIGWTSWKKRWFILTRTSLIFFRSDPSSIPQKSGEVNLTLGGIDLNNSGSVVVKEDKKLLTVLFPDGRDGRAFTLKAETLEDLNEWKTELENALAQAPNAACMMGQNGIFKDGHADEVDGTSEQSKDKQPGKSLVIGRPILLALEEVDGSPSFLEKALRFIEEHGIKVEGILRQAADVDDVEHRIREYEQGKMEFSLGEDAHVIADCVKYFLRELPSSPVPASCCNALLEACRTDRGSRVNAMRAAIYETFPEPIRRLLQRMLVMMQTVASHKAVNRMSTSAVAACMAPLLLRPLLAGDCEIETNFDVGGDSSIQLLKAAAAANHAQAIMITLLEEYNNIFNEGSMSPGLYSDSEGFESEEEEVTDDDEYYEDDEHDDASQESDAYTEDDLDNVSSGTSIDTSASHEDLYDNKGHEIFSSGSKSSGVDNESKSELMSPSSFSLSLHDHVGRSVKIAEPSEKTLRTRKINCGKQLGDISREKTWENMQTGHHASACVQKSTSLSNRPLHGTKRPTVWGRTSARKNLSMESIDCKFEDEVELKMLEASKIELQSRIYEEVEGNSVLQANLEQRKKALHDRRLALEQYVARLQEQLQKERDKRTALEAGLSTSQRPLPVPVMIDEKLKADIEEINQAEADITNLKQKFDELCMQLNQQHGQNDDSIYDSTSKNQTKVKDKQQERIAGTVRISGRSASKDATLDGAENVCRYKPMFPPNKHPPQNQLQGDQAHSCSSRHASSNSKKHSTRSEGANSTTSALTKLTTRLNFLKERRSQIASELQNLDKRHGSGHAVTIPENVRGSESSQSAQNPDKGLAIDGQSLSNSENIRKSDTLTTKNLDVGLYLDVQHPRLLDGGRSEGRTPRNAEKVQGSKGQRSPTPRNSTR